MADVRRGGGAPLMGLLLLVIGVVLLLGNLDVLNYDLGDLFREWWPAILIAIGISHLLQGRVQSAVVLLVLGGAFLVFSLDLLPRGFFRDYWPLVLVLVGGVMVFRFFRPAPEGDEETVRDGESVVDRGDTFRVFQMLGGSRRTVTSQSFRGGDATAFMGGVEVDLTGALPVPGGARIDATAIMGGVDLEVPRDWEVTITGTPLLGGLVDRRPARVETEGGAKAPRLQVRATVLLGGLEIK